MANAPKRTFLASTEDWEDWERDFKTLAVANSIWNCISPDSNETFLEKPSMPEFSSYPKKIVGRSATRRGASSSDTITATTQTQDGDPESLDPAESEERADHRTRARSMADLTEKDRAAYDKECMYYERKVKDYDKQQVRIEKVTSWVLGSVSASLRSAACEPTESLHEWYMNLLEQVGVADTELELQTREKYRRAIKPLSRVPEDFAAWISQWEEVMAYGQRKEIPEILKANLWFDDLSKALHSIMSQWITAYRTSNKKDIELNDLSFRTVARDLRHEARVRNILKIKDNGSKINKGVFGPTFAAQDDADNRVPPARAQQGPREDERGRREWNSPAKRKRSSSENRSDASCRACDGNHTLANCFYAFPHKAPAKFKEKGIMRFGVDHRIRTDPTLEEEIRRIGKGKDQGKPL